MTRRRVEAIRACLAAKVVVIAVAISFAVGCGTALLAAQTAGSTRPCRLGVPLAPATSPAAPPTSWPSDAGATAEAAVLRVYDVADLLDRPVRRTLPTKVAPPTEWPQNFWAGQDGPDLFGNPAAHRDEQQPTSRRTR
jgi:hypothetical protein